MKILIINPNTTASMTATIDIAARRAASVSTTIVTVNPQDGPPSIEGYYDQAFAVPGLIGEIIRHRGTADAVIIGCFDDTGLDAARCTTRAPVLGIGEAAFHMASLIAGRFGVVTTLRQSIPSIEQNLIRYGLSVRCTGVRACDVPVLELERPNSNAHDRIAKEIKRSIDEDGAEAIILGCAGMADLALALTHQVGVPVLEGVSCAVRLCEGLVHLGLLTAVQGGYQRPRPKSFAGMFSPFSPVG
ncbi:aspartate/glutamate racemase family protein [Mesorhizobium ciceri]|uniref:aspartate/glutamate racemase family protein n=1 Tax=Mesorhizobium TaxID=68287 RepID=UPI0007A94822|nr:MULTISPECIES: aspartate/glutamate racemase family protein [Mesorhizobium]AMY01625.1 Asp/Glu/hydantoin racemase [Mesorhizobium ciceri biovar biserrulae]MDF3153879.1 aspartate/glutamate racemase family protein [Mesorhizobium sp. XAP10]MDF3247352.1 aspartate/glutamate racemase family protein [Mesorhizobium sp. XAP4]